MIASALILSISVALLAAWFRYICGLILGARTSHNFAPQFATANRLDYPSVQCAVRSADAFEGLQSRLQRDFEVLGCLLRQSRQGAIARSDEWLLLMDYQLLGAFLKFSGPLSRRYATRALAEMCQILDYFANLIGQRTSCNA